MDNYIYGTAGSSPQYPGFNQPNWPNPTTPTNPYTQNPYQGGNPPPTSTPYVIRSKLSGRCLDISQSDDWGNQRGDLIIYDYVGGPNQQFYIIPEGQFVILKSVKSGKVLDAYYKGEERVGEGAHVPNSVRVRENNYNGGTGQKWRIVETAQGLGEYYVYCSDGKVMDVSGEDGRNNTPVLPYTQHGKHNQIWYITPAATTPKK